MNYTEYVKTLQNMLVEGVDDPSFADMTPRVIEYAELRIYREMDFLNSRTANTSVATVSGSRNVSLPATFVVLQSLNLITPAGTTNPELGTRIPLERVSLDFLDMVWSTAATTGTPSQYALLSDTAIKLGMTPNGAYTCEFIGTQRPAPLSAANPNTFITDNMPDLFIAASMVFGFGYQQNFGAQSENPQAAQSWEAQYQLLKSGVNIEELKRKSESVSWQTFQPSPIANTQRERN